MNNILSIDYKDFLKNQKRLPDKTSSEAEPFYEFHKKLCLEGCYVDGVYFNPFLYWHLNMWNTEVDIIDERGYISQKYMNPYFRDNEWIITNAIDKAHQEKKGLVLLGCRRLAKALKNDELLYTEKGTIFIGDSKVGDKIYDHNGQLTTITGVYPQGKIPIYELLLEDGRKIICCENHIWNVYNRRNKKIENLTIKQLLPKYKRSRIHNGYKDGKTRHIEECYYAIPNNKAVDYSKKNVLISPYYLGLWLGDGSSRRTGITTTDTEIKDYIFNYAEKLQLKVRAYEKEYIITSKQLGGRSDKNKLLNYFKHYNLIQNKHIPYDYLYGSIEQRLELLQGLMDTDGSVYKNGTISFTTTNKQLANDFYQLCRSLGINLTKKQFIPKLYEKECGVGWLFILFTELPIFKLKRKLNNYKLGNKGKQFKINYTSIRNIKLIGEDNATCITVDNKDELFLTTNYTVTHNSVIEASYIAWGATFDENSQNVISGLNSPDIKLITDKLDKGLNFLPWYYKWDRIEDNWKNQVTLGIKSKGGSRYPFSAILIRNLDEGNNEEAIAGTKPRKLIIDEIGKGSFLRGLQAAIPGFTTPFGWGCSPILTGTGGDMQKFFDAKQLMFDVGAFNFLEFKNNKDERRVHGLFLGHSYRLEAKEDSTLGAYLNSPKKSQLHEIEMKVSNIKKADEITDDTLAKRKKSGDRAAYLKEKMYFPKEVDDIFLNENTNIFDIDSARAQQVRLKTNEIQGSYIELYHDGESVKVKASQKIPISNYPHKPNENKDAPIVVWEMPMVNPPYGLYVMGVDSYREGKSAYSDSLGAVYVFKRMHDIYSEKFQDMFVASYVARPDKKEVWQEQARLLAKFYNARVMVENNETSFIDYMISKGDAHLLEKQPVWLREIVPNTKQDKDYGLNRTSDKIIDFLHGNMKKYLNETIHKEVDENGSIISETTGVRRIRDLMLLEEIIQYNEDGNFDRLIAAELAITCALKLDPLLGKISKETDGRIKAMYNKKTKRSIFENSSKLNYKETNKIKKLFG